MADGSRYIRDIALALARLNSAMKSAGLEPVVVVVVTERAFRSIEGMPKAADYMTRVDPRMVYPVKIAGVRIEPDMRT